MRALVLLIACTFCFISCKQGKQPLKGETKFQRELNAEFKDATKSPLTESDRKHFKGLEFFKFDSTYIVTAQLERTPQAKPFKMKTTTSRNPEYVEYGQLHFKLKGQSRSLTVYQNLELITQKGYETYLFLPFLDETNGFETYGGGRYIDTKIPSNNTIVIDFNSAYNPYCAYNEKYSCPIVPRQNYLKIRVEAGVKKFK